jgi:flagellar basal body-associated protein FliL
VSKPYGTATLWIVIISMVLSILIALFAVLAYLSLFAPVPAETQATSEAFQLVIALSFDTDQPFWLNDAPPAQRGTAYGRSLALDVCSGEVDVRLQKL